MRTRTGLGRGCGRWRMWRGSRWTTPDFVKPSRCCGTSFGRRSMRCVRSSGDLCRDRPWVGIAAAAVEGGADCLQLREKGLDGRELLERARALVAVARGRGVSVIVNDRPDVALLAGADGVHLGQ